MLRSFSYAAYAALFASSDGHADVFTRLEPWARAWILWTSAAFQRGYLAAAGGAGFLPVDAVQRASVLDLFLIEKALYELQYEQNSRPDWVRIPSAGTGGAGVTLGAFPRAAAACGFACGRQTPRRWSFDCAAGSCRSAVTSCQLPAKPGTPKWTLTT